MKGFIMDINWKKIKIEDKEIINRYYAKTKYRTCEFTFANNLLWSPFYGIYYAIVDEMLVFMARESVSSVTFPYGDGDIKKTMDLLMEYFKENGKEFKMHLVSPSQFEVIDNFYPGQFKIEYNRDDADYIYESEKLISLSGKKLHSKRNHINKFKENHTDWQYESITDENVQECIEMTYEWKKQNDSDIDGKNAEYQVTLEALRLKKELGLVGGLLRLEGKVIAFTLGEECCECTFIVHIEKAFSEIQGAYPLINQQFIEHEAINYQYINREEDTGSEGLRKAKLSYNPIFLVEKGTVTPIK